MNRKKCYCSNKFCKCLFGCGCTVSSSSGYGKCMCCIMEENDKRLLRRGRVVPGTIDPSGGEKCECNFDTPSFYDIIVFNVDDEEYWSCRYGCMVEITAGNFNPNSVEWDSGRVENAHGSDIQITYESSNVETTDNVSILIVKEEDLQHVWCKVVSISTNPSSN